jgi:hypothetical protein
MHDIHGENKIISSDQSIKLIVVLSLRTSTIWKKILLEKSYFQNPGSQQNQEHIWNFFVTMEGAKGTAKYMQLLQSYKLELVMIKAGRFEIKFGFGL